MRRWERAEPVLRRGPGGGERLLIRESSPGEATRAGAVWSGEENQKTWFTLDVESTLESKASSTDVRNTGNCHSW